jgi:putative transposase
MEMKYPSDLTQKQWQIVKEILPKDGRGAHFQKHSKRKLINAVLYLVKTGCQWRQLPHDFPPFTTVSSFYRRATTSGLWDRILTALIEKNRVDNGRNPSPSYAIVDSQSVKTCYASDERGFDGGKKLKEENGT